jgi:hypothetical protein
MQASRIGKNAAGKAKAKRGADAGAGALRTGDVSVLDECAAVLAVAVLQWGVGSVTTERVLTALWGAVSQVAARPARPAPSCPVVADLKPKEKSSLANKVVFRTKGLSGTVKEGFHVGPHAKPVAAVAPPEAEAAGPSDCCICLDRRAALAFTPCGHVAVCETCDTAALTKCPVCRADIQTRTKLFY